MNNHIGERYVNKHGEMAEIIEYINCKDVIIKFEYGYTKPVQMGNLKKGKFTSPYTKKYYNVGYLGEGEYVATVDGVKTRAYIAWNSMLTRCYDIKNGTLTKRGYRSTVCEEWLNDFQSFYDWAINNGYSDDLTIDRIDNDGNYEPSNCRWSTVKEQCNNRSSNINITIGNATKSLMSWCEIFNVDYKKVHARYQRN